MHQPQTLVTATVLLYLNAFFSLLRPHPLLLLLAVGLGAGGFGIANERKWGYNVAVISSVANLALLVWVLGLGGIFEGLNVISFLFDVALVALVLHPMSRDYQKIWFK